MMPFDINKANNMWKEFNQLKKRVEELELRGFKIIEDSWTLLNNEDLEDELKDLIKEIKFLVQKHDILTISASTDNP